jgi:hypothetical protein
VAAQNGEARLKETANTGRRKKYQNVVSGNRKSRILRVIRGLSKWSRVNNEERSKIENRRTCGSRGANTNDGSLSSYCSVVESKSTNGGNTESEERVSVEGRLLG